MKTLLHTYRRAILATALLLVSGMAIAPTAALAEEEIRLIVRGDDIGFCHSANVACIKCYRDGIMQSVEIMVPAPWYREAVKMLKENPGLDVGVHLTLNAEWSGMKWGPVTKAPSLIDEYGYFDVRIPRVAKTLTPATEAPAKAATDEDVEREFDAQIRLAIADIPRVSHLTAHMGTPLATPAWRAIVEKLGKKYHLPTELPGVKRAGPFGRDGTPAEREAAMVQLIAELKPGTWLLVEHPGLDDDEMRAIREDVAKARGGVTQAWTSPRVKEAVKKHNVKLMSYADYCRATEGK